MTIEQLITIAQRRIQMELTYEETTMYEIFEPRYPSWRFSIQKEETHRVELTSFEAKKLIDDICSFFYISNI